MEKTPLITIATVTYNAVQTLERTLRSVAEQDYDRIEHLIVDGCSKDGTFALIQRYVEQNTLADHPHQIRVVREPDEGLYDAMNKVLQQATGDYVVFLNAGDKLHESTTVSTVVKSLEWEEGDYQNPAIAYGETDLVDDEGNFVRHRRLQAPEHLTWESFRMGMLVCHQSFYVRRDLTRDVLYNRDYRFSADVDWCIRMLKVAKRRRLLVINTHEILTDYLMEGMTTKNHKQSLKERWQVMVNHYGLWTTAICHLWFVIRAFAKK